MRLYSGETKRAFTTGAEMHGVRQFDTIRGKVEFDVQRRLHWEVIGADPSASRALLWTHGLTSSIESERQGGWPFTGLDNLSAALPVLRYDARGHGESDSGPSSTWSDMGRDVLKVRKVLGRRRVALCGTSMGAAASLIAALQDPSQADALILATPPTCYDQRRAFLPIYRRSLEFARQSGLQAAKEAAAKMIQPPIFGESSQGRAMFEVGWRHKFAMGLERYCAALDGALESDLPPAEELRQLAMPVLILAWRSDVQHPLQSAQLLAELLPNAEIFVAHSWSEIEEFPEVMQNFLDRVMR